MQTCCDNMKWERVADLSHADGVEFTLGKCVSCGANLVNLWTVSTNEPNNHVVVDDDFVAQVKLLEGVALKHFMREWLNAD